MDFRLLRTFDVVASLLSFSRAARMLHCTQSTVSAQVRSLEEDLGAPVFARLGRRIALTPAGEALRRRVQRLLAFEQDVRAAVQAAGEETGRIRLRAPQSVVDLHLPAILQRFCARHLRVGFDVSNCGHHELPDELRSGELDAAFSLAMPVESADLRSEAVLGEPMAFVASPASDLARRAPLTLADLSRHTLLLAKHDCAYRMKLQRELAEAAVELAAVIDLNSVAAIVRCLRAGVGVGFLPERAVAEELAARRLVRLRWHAPLEDAEVFFIRHADKPLAGAFGAFVAQVEQHFAALRAHHGEGKGGGALGPDRALR